MFSTTRFKSINKLYTRSIYLTQINSVSKKTNVYRMNYDRRIQFVDYKDSIQYMKSEAYKRTYENELIWKLYRRNHKSLLPSKNTRHSCINEDGFVATSYPCPICRDEYLVIHPENHELLKQFIDPSTGETYGTKLHGLCRTQYRKLLVAIEVARDIGTLTFEIPERVYDYDKYYQK